MVPFPMTLNEL